MTSAVAKPSKALGIGDWALGKGNKAKPSRVRRLCLHLGSLRWSHRRRRGGDFDGAASRLISESTYNYSMSAAPRMSGGFGSAERGGDGYVGLRMGAAEFLGIGETRERLQLVQGVVVLSPQPTPRHQGVVRQLIRQLEAYVGSPEGRGADFYADVDVQLHDMCVYQPDLACYGPGRLSGIPERLTTAPDLVIEVLSPGTRAFDLTTKREDYGAFGVREYWTIEQLDASVRRFVRREGMLVEVPATEDRIASEALEGFVLDVAQVRAWLANG